MKNKSNCCAGKKKHATHGMAMAVMHRTTGFNLMVYHCRCCGFFHVGNRRDMHHARGTYHGGSRYERLIEAIDAAVRS